MMMRSRAVRIVLQRGRGRRGFGGGRGADGRFTRCAVGIDNGGSNSNARFYDNFGIRNNHGKDDRDEKMTEIGELIGDGVRVVGGGTEEYANGSGGIRFGRRGGGTSTTSTTGPRFFKASSSPCSASCSSSPSLSYSSRFLPLATIETTATRGAAASRLYHGGTFAAQQEGKKNAGGGGGENNKGGAGTPTPSLEFAHYERRQSRWSDTDGYGHVNNSVYYAYMDDAICVHNVRNGVGAEYPRFVVENGMKFYEPLSFPNDVVVGIRVVHLGSSSVTYDVGIYGVAADDDDGGGEKEDEEEERFLAARGKFVHVYLDDKNYRPAPIPQKVRDVLQTLVMNDGDDN